MHFDIRLKEGSKKNDIKKTASVNRSKEKIYTETSNECSI
jgi:hypothetical protein